jgi:hypothetical protein
MAAPTPIPLDLVVGLAGIFVLWTARDLTRVWRSLRPRDWLKAFLGCLFVFVGFALLLGFRRQNTALLSLSWPLQFAAYCGGLLLALFGFLYVAIIGRDAKARLLREKRRGMSA